MLLCPPEAPSSFPLALTLGPSSKLSSSNLAVTSQLESVEQNHVNSRINKHE